MGNLKRCCAAGGPITGQKRDTHIKDTGKEHNTSASQRSRLVRVGGEARGLSTLGLEGAPIHEGLSRGLGVGKRVRKRSPRIRSRGKAIHRAENENLTRQPLHARTLAFPEPPETLDAEALEASPMEAPSALRQRSCAFWHVSSYLRFNLPLSFPCGGWGGGTAQHAGGSRRVWRLAAPGLPARRCPRACMHAAGAVPVSLVPISLIGPHRDKPPRERHRVCMHTRVASPATPLSIGRLRSAPACPASSCSRAG